MKLFKGHAVLPRNAQEPQHPVRTYLVVADDWEEARVRIGRREPGAEFITVPGEIPDPLMIDTHALDPRECKDLRSASAWNEARLRTLVQ
jgi:hypothetical protein